MNELRWRLIALLVWSIGVFALVGSVLESLEGATVVAIACATVTASLLAMPQGWLKSWRVLLVCYFVASLAWSATVGAPFLRS